MTDDALRSIQLTRTGPRRYEATNVRGGTIPVASDGSADFTPVELLLVALAGCTSVDVDLVTTRRAEPVSFEATASARRTEDSRLEDLEVSFRLAFPEGPDGDAARARIAAAVKASHDRDCTVSRTLESGGAVRMLVAD